MTEPKDATDEERAAWRRYFAIESFKASWTLLGRESRSPDDDAELLAAAFASRWLWGPIGTPENHMIGEHQISKVAASVGRGELSLEYAERAAAIVAAEGWADWRRAAVHEALARANHAAGRVVERDRHLAEGRQALDAIEDPEDREVIEQQLREIPGWA